MKTPKLGVIEDLVRQTESYIVTDSLNIPVWHTKRGYHVTPNKFTVTEAEGAELSLGSAWTTGYDMTTWFSASVAIPPEMDGKKVYLQIDFGGEAIVRIDGEIVGAVSSGMNSGWVHRDIIHLPVPAICGTDMKIEIEATVNSGGFCDAAMAGAKTIDYTLKTARLIAVDSLAEQYYFLLLNSTQALSCIQDSVIRNRVYRAVDDSVHALDFDMGSARYLSSVPHAYEILKNGLAEIPGYSSGEVIMTGHCHLDVAWLWTVKEIVRKTARTFANNLALMEIYPDFRFCQSQAVLYSFIKDYYPDLYEKVKEKVKSGQWEITGGAWVEADTNIASGESLIRQLLYGRGFFEKEFGVTSEIYWLPDCFGFTWALPQIIAKSGMKYFMTAKLYGNDTVQFPHSQFRWRSHSGDEITAFLAKSSYNGAYTPAHITGCWNNNEQADITGVTMGMYGYGDGGGGCTYGMVENGRAIAAIPGLAEVKTGTAKEYFERLGKKSAELPVWDGELYYENHRGTYTSQAFVKKSNRRGEFLLRNIELLSVFAERLTGQAYPCAELEALWKKLLINQFHDILPGTSIHEVYDVCREEYKQLLEAGTLLKSKALSALNSQIHTEKPSVIVWNYNTHTVTAPVKVSVPHLYGSLRDMNGRTVYAEYSQSSEGLYTAEFLASDIPSVGYRVYTFCEEQPSLPSVTATPVLLENSMLRVELDANGIISSIYDKLNSRESLKGKGNLLTVYQDKPIHESAWNLEIDMYKKSWELTEADSIRVLSSTSLKGEIEIVRSFNKSVITQRLTLYADSPMLVFETHADWQETEKTLKTAFETDIRAMSASYEIAHGAIERPTHCNTPSDFAKYEVSMHKWCDLSQADYGVSLINDCKYGGDIHEGVMRLTLLRSPNCPDTVADKGEHEFEYALYPHSGRWQDASTVDYAFELNNPLEGVFVAQCEGTVDGVQRLLDISDKGVICDALKPAQDGNGYILRIYESLGKTVNAVIKPAFPPFDLYSCKMTEQDSVLLESGVTQINTRIKPFEVQTFRMVLTKD